MIYLSKLKDDTMYVSEEHKVVMSKYYKSMDNALRMVGVTKEKYKLLNDLLLVIVDYSNSFSEERDAYFYEWIRVIPTNITYSVAAFIAGMKDDSNAEICSIYYSKVLHNAAKCLEELNIVQPVNE